MALESFTVVYKQMHAGAGTQVPFKNQTEAAGGKVTTETAMVATLEAGSAQEAATAVRRAFGDGVITQKTKVVKTSSLEEKTA